MAPIRFYVDADLLGLAQLLVQVRSDVTYPGDPGGRGPDQTGRPPCPIATGAKDEQWIPYVAGQGWVVITKDRHHRHRPAEKKAILDHRARVVHLDARHKLTKWNQLEIVVACWRKIEDQLLPLPGPWVYRATRTGHLARQKLE
jgi:uncharacterized protein with PIN domain